MDNLTAVPSRVAQLAAAFSRPEPIRRGSLYERRMKCGQAACTCQHDPQAAHGPYFTLTQKVGGKTRSRYISPEQAPVVVSFRQACVGELGVWRLRPEATIPTRFHPEDRAARFFLPCSIWLIASMENFSGS
jgi:hypothetical protein